MISSFFWFRFPDESGIFYELVFSLLFLKRRNNWKNSETFGKLTVSGNDDLVDRKRSRVAEMAIFPESSGASPP